MSRPFSSNPFSLAVVEPQLEPEPAHEPDELLVALYRAGYGEPAPVNAARVAYGPLSVETTGSGALVLAALGGLAVGALAMYMTMAAGEEG